MRYAPILRSLRCFGMSAKESRDKLLFTPGPLTTTLSVKEAMLNDMGSRDEKFIKIIKETREGVVDVANLTKPDDWTAVFVQGSGTFGVESIIQTSVPKENGRLLVISNGAYGSRAAKIGKRIGVDTAELAFLEDQWPCLKKIEEAVDDGVTNVLCVHSETTSGVVNQIKEIGDVVKSKAKDSIFIVDAMSSFGGIPIDIEEAKVDFLASSANKCIQGSPGFAIVLAHKAALEKCEGNSRSLSLDLYDQWKGLEKDGQFRFTPPTHSILAFKKALEELKAEGGVEARFERYRSNQRIITDGMRALGFETYLAEEMAGPIITSFRFPESKNWDFKTFYDKLSVRNCLIYPGKVTNADCFRIGHIGALTNEHTEYLLGCIKEACAEMEL